jgi:hypothetical protein
MRFILLCAVLIAIKTNAQDRIILTVADTSGIHQKVRTAFIKTNFQVKDLPGDTISTYSREVRGLTGYAVAFAVIEGNTVTLSGYYSPKKMNYFGFTNVGREVKRIRKYKGSKTWPVLEKVATLIY